MVKLTKEEIQAIINTLSLLPYKDVAGLVLFFSKKIEEASVKKVKKKEKSSKLPVE